MRILVIDDNKDMLEMISETLIMEGHDVLTCKNGEEAIDTLMKKPLPDLVITDMVMPLLDGLGVIKRVRATPAWQRIPCVMISGDPMDEPRALQSGANGFLVKPFRYRELENILKRFAR